jgi:hypothetical protein
MGCEQGNLVPRAGLSYFSVLITTLRTDLGVCPWEHSFARLTPNDSCRRGLISGDDWLSLGPGAHSERADISSSI